MRLTVRLLVTSTSSGSTELLGFAASRIGDEQSSVVLDEHVFDFLFTRFVNV